MFPRGYDPSSYWPPSYWPKTGGVPAPPPPPVEIFYGTGGFVLDMESFEPTDQMLMAYPDWVYDVPPQETAPLVVTITLPGRPGTPVLPLNILASYRQALCTWQGDLEVLAGDGLEQGQGPSAPVIATVLRGGKSADPAIMATVSFAPGSGGDGVLEAMAGNPLDQGEEPAPAGPQAIQLRGGQNGAGVLASVK